VTAEHSQALHPSIPRVQCPQCGAIMRLARITASQDGTGATTIFDCECSFVYQCSEREKLG
jgi:hypothetical protein